MKEMDAWFPASSVAVHVTAVVPSGKVEPEAGEQPILDRRVARELKNQHVEIRIVTRNVEDVYSFETAIAKAEALRAPPRPSQLAVATIDTND